MPSPRSRSFPPRRNRAHATGNRPPANAAPSQPVAELPLAQHRRPPLTPQTHRGLRSQARSSSTPTDEEILAEGFAAGCLLDAMSEAQRKHRIQQTPSQPKTNEHASARTSRLRHTTPPKHPSGKEDENPRDPSAVRSHPRTWCTGARGLEELRPFHDLAFQAHRLNR